MMMSEAVPPNVELMRSLRHLVRGLSALFWGLPLTLLVCLQSAITDLLKPLGVFPPLAATSLLFFGLLELGHFQRQERVWRESLEIARILALTNIGLSPFVFFWNRVPYETFYAQMVVLLAFTSLAFLVSLNRVLRRLTAMLPDETLRTETRFFTAMNFYLMLSVVALVGVFYLFQYIDPLPRWLLLILDILSQARRLLLLFLVLLPLAMTMTLLWKTKEIVLSSVFGREH
jgi:hypothetical protein